MKYSSPWHAEKCCILLILSEHGRYFFHDGSELSGGVPCWGGISFMEARWKWRWCPWSVSTGPRRPWAAEGPGRASSRRVELPNSDPAPLVWRVPEGLEGLAAVHVGGGGAWSRCRWVAAGPGRASRSTTPSRQARVWRSRGRAAAHRHTERPGRARQIMRSGLRAGRRPRRSPAQTHKRRPEHQWRHTGSKTAATQRKMPTQTPSFTASQQHSQKSYEKYESFIGSS